MVGGAILGAEAQMSNQDPVDSIGKLLWESHCRSSGRRYGCHWLQLSTAIDPLTLTPSCLNREHNKGRKLNGSALYSPTFPGFLIVIEFIEKTGGLLFA